MNNLTFNLSPEAQAQIFASYQTAALALCSMRVIDAGSMSAQPPYTNVQLAALELYQLASAMHIARKYGLS